MAIQVLMRRHLGALRPIDKVGEAALAEIGQSEVVRVEVRRVRNVQHHRKFFALLNAVFPHQQVYPTLDAFRAALSVALGHGEQVKLPDGRIIIVPGSIAFSKMDQSAFDEFYKRAVELVLTRILPGVASADLEREVNEILEGYGRVA